MTTKCYVVTRDENGEDRIYGGTFDNRVLWTLIPNKMRRLSAAKAIDLARSFAGVDHGDGPRVVVGHEELGPMVTCLGADGGYRMCVTGHLGMEMTAKK